VFSRKMLWLSFFFLVNCIQHDGTERSILSSAQHKIQISEPLATCNLTYKTYNTIVSPDQPNWIGHLIIVSPLIIGSNPVVSELGFYVDATGFSAPSLVDILIYDSFNGIPTVLKYKISNLDLSPFPPSQIACVPFSATFTIGQTIFIGFWTHQGDAAKVISRQTVTGAQYWYNVNNLPSPSIGSQFPSYNIWAEQLLMGFSVGNPCNGLSCSGCTQNSGCVWCLNSQSCISTAGIPQCPSWTRNPSVCNMCQQYGTCLTCASVQNQCSWCETNGKPSVCVSTPNDKDCTTAITNPGFCNMY